MDCFTAFAMTNPSSLRRALATRQSRGHGLLPATLLRASRLKTAFPMTPMSLETLSAINGMRSWTNTGTLATQNGHTYAVWHNSTAQALIDQQVMTAAYVL